MAQSKFRTKRALAWRVVLTTVLLLTAGFLLARRWSVVTRSLRVAGGSDLGWFTLALVLMASTFCTAAIVYGTLALHRLRYRQTLLVEFAGAFANRLLPAGLGGLGLNGVYLYRKQHTLAEATAVVSVNNLLGIAAHLSLLAGLLVWRPQAARALFASRQWAVSWVWIATALCLMAVLLMPTVRKRLVAFVHHLLQSVRIIGLVRLLRALMLSACITISYTLILFSAARSVAVDLGLAQIFIIFSIGMLVGTATPTPGGLVGTEAALFAALTGYKVSDTDAGAVVLLFRLVTYWLPLVPGAAALWLARARELI